MAAGGLLVTCVVMIGFAGVPDDVSWLGLLALVVVFAIASAIEFEAGQGSAVPTQLAFVPLLYFCPPSLIPLAVATGFVLGTGPSLVRGELRATRVIGLAGNAWFAVGPSLAIVAFGPPERSLDGLAWLAALVGIQVATELVVTPLRENLALGTRPSLLLQPIAWASMVDLLLTPVAFATAIAFDAPYVGLAILTLLLLMREFARERRERLDAAIELAGAYRGTAYLLGDVVEADDAYTGSHSRDVLELTLAVCDRLGLSPHDRRRAEFTALLHDIGKLRISGEVINKPGPLDEEEWALMRTHTVEGERLLATVGGLLGEVGSLVRSCHEHVDGTGYPDGLVGDEIPLISRVVAACDAFNAMVTDRSYRPAMDLDEAVTELSLHAGAQFDPDVVEAIVGVALDAGSRPERARGGSAGADRALSSQAGRTSTATPSIETTSTVAPTAISVSSVERALQSSVPTRT